MKEQTQKPGVEPEIIPPDRSGGSGAKASPRTFVSVKTREGTYRYSTTSGLLTTVLSATALGIIALLIALVLLGTLLVSVAGLAIIALLIVVALLGRGLRWLRNS